jgi:polysaccharide biosynthesis/export protein
MRLLFQVAIGALTALSSGCAILPSGSPTIRELSVEREDRQPPDVEFFEVDDGVANVLSQSRSATLADLFSHARGAPASVLGPGDVIQISVWEPGGSGLFGPANQSSGIQGGGGAASAASQGGARQATLQPLVIERGGYISVPFAGRVAVGGLTVEQARARIEEKLRANAIQPQVLLSLAIQNSHTAMVGGEVGRPGLLALSARGDRVLDVIANAGGSKFPAYESVVRIRRGKETAAVSLKAVIDSQDENIFVQRGDSIFVSREPRTYSAFGATGRSGHYPFEADTILLTEAVAKAGGLVDNQADLSGVLLFRHETGRTLAKINARYGAEPDRLYPTVYRLDWRTARGILYARRIKLRDKDTILIANAEGAQLLKLLTLARGVSGIVSDISGNSSSSSSSK